MKNPMKIMALVLYAAWITFMVASCIDLRSSEQRLQAQKEQMAQDLFGRIQAMVYSNGFTPEWNNIEKRILANQDTLFLIENSEFKISITMRHNMILDSIKVIQDSVEQKKAEPRGW
jgi:uncharacterized protein YeeX (DUF496 family)